MVCVRFRQQCTTGVVAEYLLAQALGVAAGTRVEWDAYDLTTPSGLKVEVKSAAYIQSWHQSGMSRIGFDIAPKRGWDAATNVMADTPMRSADVYVFAVLAHQDQATIDPLDVSQWEFYVLPSSVLNERCGAQKWIALSALLNLSPRKADFAGLKRAVSC